ncbi:MAG: outer membrane beta-barrel protein [Bdellovibrionota bacterium]
MKNSLFRNIALMAPLAALAQPAFAAQTSLSLAAIGNVADARVPEQVNQGSGVTVDTDNRLGWGIGALVSTQGSTLIGLETGALLINRSFQYGSDSFNFTQSQLNLQIPLLARVNFGQMFSLGAGPFISMPVGPVNNRFTVGSSSANFNVDHDITELGVQAAASFGLPVAANTTAFIEARYTYGLKDLTNNTKNYANTNDLSTLVGVRITL